MFSNQKHILYICMNHNRKVSTHELLAPKIML